MKARHLAASVLAAVLVYGGMFFPLMRLGIPALASGSCSLLGAVLTGQALDQWLRQRDE
jgi:hypothetical protein